MGSSSAATAHSVPPVDLPERLFATNCYPSHAVKINSYSTPRYLIDILDVLKGTPELDRLLSSPLGSLFSLHVRRSSLSGQLVHQMLCRQICTENKEELWFVFGGHPIRFPLLEFHELTGLCCTAYPPQSALVAAISYAHGSSPYWYKLIGGKLGGITIKDIVAMLKNDPQMPSWRKFRLSLVVIVEGILLSRTQPLKPSVEVVEMVKDIDFFLKYPWGRHSFQRILRMVKVGPYIKSKPFLIEKLKQSSLAIHGFPLAIQLLAFRCIPSLLSYLPHPDDASTFLDKALTRLPKCKSFHTSNILEVEYDCKLKVLFPQAFLTHFSPSDEDDPRIKKLEGLLTSAFRFSRSMWFGGDAGLPPIRSLWKRKPVPPNSETSCSEDEDCPIKRKGNRKGKAVTKEGANLSFEDLESFKKSLLVEVRELLRSNQETDAPVRMPNTASTVNRHVSPTRPRVTRSGCAGQNTKATLERSLNHSQQSNTALNQSSSHGTTHVNARQTAAVTSQQSNSEVRPTTESLAPSIEFPKPGIFDEVASPVLPPNNSSFFKVQSSTDGVDLCRSKRKVITEKKTVGLSLLDEAYTSGTKNFAAPSSIPSTKSPVIPGKSLSAKSSTSDEVFPRQLFNPQADCNMGFLLVDPTPEALSSFPNTPPNVVSSTPSSPLRNSQSNANIALDIPPLPSPEVVPPRSLLDLSPSMQRRVHKRRSTTVLPAESSGGTMLSSPTRTLRSHKRRCLAEIKDACVPVHTDLETFEKENPHCALLKAEVPAPTFFSSPAHNLRSRKVGNAASGNDASAYILRGLENIKPQIVTKFFSKLKKFRGSSYTIDGDSVPAQFFYDLAKPKNWLTSMHIDLLIGFGWKHYGAFLASRRISILDSMFATIIGPQYMSFKQDFKQGQFVWHQLLIEYVRGSITGRTTKLEWIRDVDLVYMPMNWGKKHWVGLCIDLLKGHITILDPFEDCTSTRKVVSYLSPFAQMLAPLIQSVVGYIPSTWPANGFTFARLPGVAQNTRGGDCAPLSVKLIELHAHCHHSALGLITPTQVDNLRLRYAMDLYEYEITTI